MTISGNVSSRTFDTSRAGLRNVNIGVLSVPLETDNAIWPCGLILGRKANKKYVPYGEMTEQIGTGDASATGFSGQVGPIEPGTASVEAGAVTLTDDGCGNLTGSGGSGVLNYDTGKVVVSFDAAPAGAAAVNLTCYPDPYAVLDEETDTARSSSALATRCGGVGKAHLKVGVSSPAAPSDAVLERLERQQIFAL